MGRKTGEPMPLTRAPEGSLVEVIALRGGREPAWRAVELGLAPGTRLRVVVNRRALLGFPLIVRVGERLLAVSRWVAESVMVKLLEEGFGHEGKEENAQRGVGELEGLQST